MMETNITQCMSIKSAKTPNKRCPHRRRENSNFCGVHSKMKHPVLFNKLRQIGPLCTSNSCYPKHELILSPNTPYLLVTSAGLAMTLDYLDLKCDTELSKKSKYLYLMEALEYLYDYKCELNDIIMARQMLRKRNVLKMLFKFFGCTNSTSLSV